MLSYTLDEYLTKDLFQLLGLEDIPDVQKQEIFTTISKTVTARVYSFIYDDLSESERTELDNISTENVMVFLKERGYDVQAMLAEETARYRIELVQMFQIASQPLMAKTA